MLNNEIRKDVENVVIRRARRFDTKGLEIVFDEGEFYLSGGALVNDNPVDFDLFGVKERFDLEKIKVKLALTKFRILNESENAITVLGNGGQKIQFCRHWKNSMHNLVDSFDFSHCQAAVRFSFYQTQGAYCVSDALVMDSFISAAACRDTAFVGSEYPISSLMRAGKFYRRGMFANYLSYKICVIEILIAIVQRGLFDVEDAKRQLCSISDGFGGNNRVEVLRQLIYKGGTPPKPKNEDMEDPNNFPF